VGVAALTAWFIACSWVGADFGQHWDEVPWILSGVAKSIRGGTMLPPHYMYPSFLHDVVMVSALIGDTSWTKEGARVAEMMPFIVTMRRIFAVIASLTILWVFLLVRMWRDEPLEALLAAAIAAGSWELNYHSRWITVDPLMVQCAALTLCCAVAGYRRQSVRLLRASAVAAGLACSAKYTGGLLLVTVIAACWFSRDRIRRVLEALPLFALGFIAATPGALLEPRKMLSGVLEQSQIYATGWGVYSVTPGVEAGSLLAQYLGLVLFSHTPLIAAFFAIAAIGGAIVIAREDRRAAVIVLVFPVLYLALFATRHVMIVRNMLVMVPFLAALAAIGIDLRTQLRRVVVGGGIAAMVIINLAWLWTAARSIRRPPAVYLAQLAEYLDAYPDRRVALSRPVAEALRQFDGRERPVTDPRAPGVDRFVFFALESPSIPFLPNRRDSVERWFGAHEVNFNYYPTWVTADRILIMEPRKVLWLTHR
jgi:hypothetical protein